MELSLDILNGAGPTSNEILTNAHKIRTNTPDDLTKLPADSMRHWTKMSFVTPIHHFQGNSQSGFIVTRKPQEGIKAEHLTNC